MPQRPILGILLKLAAVVLFCGMAALVKFLGPQVPAGQTIFARSLIAVAIVVLIAWRTGQLHLLRTDHWRSHALRSTASGGAMFAWFVALGLAPIADVTAMTYMQPIFLSLFAVLFLGERFSAYRWLAVAAGCLGAAIMISPHLSFAASHSFGILIALASALLGALGMMFLRGMSRTEHFITITFYFSLTTLAGSAITVLWGWPMLTGRQWWIVVLLGLIGTAAQLLLSSAYRYAEASIIAPLDYSGMIVIVLLGYVLFDEMPGRSTWIGAPLVVAAGLLILWSGYRDALSLQPRKA